MFEKDTILRQACLERTFSTDSLGDH